MQHQKKVCIVLYSGVLTNKNSLSVSLHTILPLCSYLKIVVESGETQTDTEILIFKTIRALAQILKWQ